MVTATLWFKWSERGSWHIVDPVPKAWDVVPMVRGYCGRVRTTQPVVAARDGNERTCETCFQKREARV